VATVTLFSPIFLLIIVLFSFLSSLFHFLCLFSLFLTYSLSSPFCLSSFLLYFFLSLFRFFSNSFSLCVCVSSVSNSSGVPGAPIKGSPFKVVWRPLLPEAKFCEVRIIDSLSHFLSFSHSLSFSLDFSPTHPTLWIFSLLTCNSTSACDVLCVMCDLWCDV
jgi:hypothetical protein